MTWPLLLWVKQSSADFVFICEQKINKLLKSVKCLEKNMQTRHKPDIWHRDNWLICSSMIILQFETHNVSRMIFSPFLLMGFQSRKHDMKKGTKKHNLEENLCLDYFCWHSFWSFDSALKTFWTQRLRRTFPFFADALTDRFYKKGKKISLKLLGKFLGLVWNIRYLNERIKCKNSIFKTFTRTFWKCDRL